MDIQRILNVTETDKNSLSELTLWKGIVILEGVSSNTKLLKKWLKRLNEVSPRAFENLKAAYSWKGTLYFFWADSFETDFIDEIVVGKYLAIPKEHTFYC